MTEPRFRPVRAETALAFLGAVAVLVYAVDQFAKFLVTTHLVEGRVTPVVGSLLEFVYVRNSGAAFSLASGMTWVFTVIAVVVIVAIGWLARRIRARSWAVMFGLLLGGVLGNLTDRLVRPPAFGVGWVVDFISTPWMIPAIYNLADSCIVSSMVLLVVLTLRGVRLDGNPARQPNA